MSEQMELGAHARRTDPETSHEAAALVSHKVRATQMQVLRAFHQHGAMTDRALVDLVRGQAASGVRTRRSELETQGLVEFAGRFERIGRARHRVWRLTIVGLRFVEAHDSVRPVAP